MGGAGTHRLVDGSASWVLSKTGPRIVPVSSVGELVRLALGELQTVEELGSEAQKTLSAIAGGCVVYVATEAEATEGGQSMRGTAGETAGETGRKPGLGLGLECVVGWKTAGRKLMVFVGKPMKQLAEDRRAAFGLR